MIKDFVYYNAESEHRKISHKTSKACFHWLTKKSKENKFHAHKKSLLFKKVEGPWPPRPPLRRGLCIISCSH